MRPEQDYSHIAHKTPEQSREDLTDAIAPSNPLSPSLVLKRLYGIEQAGAGEYVSFQGSSSQFEPLEKRQQQ